MLVRRAPGPSATARSPLKNQVEGNVIQSLSRTLLEEVAFDTAHVTSLDWQGYPIPRFEDIPDRIDIVLVNNRPGATGRCRREAA